MKLKTGYLFVFIILLFGCSFYVVNLKFDKFYRVNGINNDNRVLLEKYLDDEEQTYLIDNQISIDLFIDYLKEDQFILQNYQYYNALKETGRYKNNKDILDVGNSLATRLDYLYKDHAHEQAKQLINLNLESAFLSSEDFHFDYISLYSTLKNLYAKNDYTFIDDTELYVEKFYDLGITDLNDIETKMTMLCESYTKETLKDLMMQPLSKDVELVFNPYDLSTVVDQQHYIGYYEPNNLLLVQDVPRLRYAMYLQSDAYHALAKMYQDLNQVHSGFLLGEAYISAQSLEKSEIGYNEYQLGLSVCILLSQSPYQNFESTDISKWLEEHAYEYGFILRYPKNKASITGYSYDAHIYRYVGKSLAKSLHDSELTLEEYSNIQADSQE